MCVAHVSASSIYSTRDLGDVTLGTLASPIRSDGQDMRGDLCLDPTNSTYLFCCVQTQSVCIEPATHIF